MYWFKTFWIFYKTVHT